jgi:protein gp37
MADVLDDEAPAGARERLWDLIDRTPFLTWQLLTKRPENYSEMLPDRFKHANVQLGTTAEDQKYFALRWPFLWAVTTRMNLLSWISYEPALGPLTLRSWANRPDWMIFGGESGNGFRPMQESWAVDLLKECRDYKIAFFMKQFAARTPTIGKTLIPAHLLVQDFPS